jgi:hypothetical protein
MPSTLNVPAPVRKSTQALNYFARLSASGAPRAEINKMKALKLPATTLQSARYIWRRDWNFGQ